MRRVLSAHAPPHATPQRRRPPACSEDVLWSALFALAVVARDTSPAYVAHLLALARAGVLPALTRAMLAYRDAVEAQVGGWGAEAAGEWGPSVGLQLQCERRRCARAPAAPPGASNIKPPHPTHRCRAPSPTK